MVRRLLMKYILVYLFFCSNSYAGHVAHLMKKSLMLLDKIDKQNVYIPRIFNQQLFATLIDLTDQELLEFLMSAEQYGNKYLINGIAAIIVDRLELAINAEIILEDIQKKVSLNTYAFIQKYMYLKKRNIAIRACGDVELSVADYVNQYGLPIEYLGNVIVLRFDNKNLTSLYGLENISLTDGCIALFTNNCITGSTLDPQFPDAPFQGLSGVYNVLLNKNQIESLPADFFTSADLMSQINLSHNKLSTLASGLFNAMNGLAAIRLSYNQLGSISSNDLNNLSYLSLLYLDHNALISLPVDLFTNNPMLTAIYLNNNLISIWPSHILDNLSQLTYLDLSYNLLTGFAPSSIPDGCQVILTGNVITSLQQAIIQASYPNVYFTF